MEEIKVSIIIPAYNVEKYILRCIQSATNQTLKEIEVIVVNDGSTDNTQNIIEKLSKEDNRIILINKKNGGLASARNAGVNISRGEYIHHLDGDDWMEPRACEDMYSFAKERDLDIVVANFYADNDNGGLVLCKPIGLNQEFFTGEEFLHILFQEKAYWAFWNKLFSRKIYKGILQPEDISYGEDALTVPKLVLNSKNIGLIDKAYIHYINNPNSITKQEISKKMYQLFKVYDRLEDYLIDKKKYKEYKEDMKFKKIRIVSSLLTQKPYWEDDNYLKAVELSLKLLKTNPEIDKNILFIKRWTLSLLLLFPQRTIFRIAIGLNNILAQLYRLFVKKPWS